MPDYTYLVSSRMDPVGPLPKLYGPWCQSCFHQSCLSIFLAYPEPTDRDYLGDDV